LDKPSETSDKPSETSGGAVASDAAVAAVVDAVVAAAKAPENLLTADEWAHLSKRDQRLLRGIFERIARRDAIARSPIDLQETRSRGERIADRVADFGGSWTFILLFLAFLVAWATVNTVVLATRAFDPYPFIFLNLMLSMIAALQAPIIMMSQKRQALRDRLAAENDYTVNLKAEVEIRQLHDKLDELREGQWVQLVAQQEEQIKLLSMLCGPANAATKPTSDATADAKAVAAESASAVSAAIRDGSKPEAQAREK
jgi:uncharacterized membrane protein